MKSPAASALTHRGHRATSGSSMHRVFLWCLAGVSGCSSKTDPQPEPVATAASATVSASPSAAASPPPRPRPLEVRMVALKGGVFTMGTDALAPQGELDAARPEHMATVPAFHIDVTEVTVDAYRRCVEDGVCSLPANKPRVLQADPRCSWYVADRGNHPVNCVTWHQADGYCKWTGKQLPTEEMWEFAARGKHGRDFPWGPGVPNHRWGAPGDVDKRLQGSCRNRHGYSDYDSDYDTIPVGCAPLGATPEGVLDLAGNVAEWTSSPGCDYATKKCDDNRRILKGGINDWSTFPHWMLGATRSAGDPAAAMSTIGFRCARLDKP